MKPLLTRACALVLLFMCVLPHAFAQDTGWPRTLQQGGATAVLYQPQVDDWSNNNEITWRQAFQLTPPGGKTVTGAASLRASTSTDTESHIVTLYGPQITSTYFSGLDSDTSAQMAQLLGAFLPPSVDVSLERLVAYMRVPPAGKSAPVSNTPPSVYVAYKPTILLQVDGKPVFADIEHTRLRFVVNTVWPLFQDRDSTQYFLLVNNVWLTAGHLAGPWSRVKQLPEGFRHLPDSGRFAPVRKVVPPPQVADAIVPAVLYSTAPAEVILFDGAPQWTPIPGTQLSFANNSMSPVFRYAPSGTYYYLTAGRWFSAAGLAGPWLYATPDLPADFANIPLDSPASVVLAAVPGTPQARDAVMTARIPTRMRLDAAAAAKSVKVTYSGDPVFAKIEGTNLKYAVNTPDKVIEVGDVYYLCQQAVWFMSPSPTGPWNVAPSVPPVIYDIPPSSPAYNVTYVTQTLTPDGYVETAYTSGYLGSFVTTVGVSEIVCDGTGWWYPPYIGYPVYGYGYGYPVWQPYATTYGGTSYYSTRADGYGWSESVDGAYGSATRAAQYNPYTGTYARGATASTAYGRQSIGQAYNPYTGTYAASHQGSSPTAQWGQSVVSQGDRAATGQHYSGANGSAGSIQGSQGGRAFASSTGAGQSFAGRSAGGDLYAGHDGNVYQNTGSGWQKYDNSTGSWSDADDHAGSGGLDSDASDRWSGSGMSDHYSDYRSFGGGSGGGGDWGGGHSFGGWGGARGFGGGGFRR